MATRSAVILAAVLLLSFPILYFIAPHILPQPRIAIIQTDELDDLSLFEKAIYMDKQHITTTKVSSSKKSHRLPSRKSHLSSSPNPRPPKIAFMFLTSSALHFQPLWIKFFANASRKHSNIYVHADPFASRPILEGPFKDKVIPSKRTQRSSPTLISAARRLIATAMLDDPSNEYYALISPHCIPLHSFKFLYNFLFDMRKLGENMELKSYVHAESQFFVLTRRHGLMVIEDRKLWKKFKLPCLKVNSCHRPEEHYFPTLLSVKDLNGCTKHSLTRVTWAGSVNGRHPYTYRPEEVSGELIYRLRASNSSSFEYMFARKFSPDSLNPLVEIADSVIFKD